MGLFAFNAEKKLAKGEEQLEKGSRYEARLTFEEILKRDGVGEGIRSRAKEGWRRARREMMEGQIEEANRAVSGGDVDLAVACLRSALDLAGDDLDAGDCAARLARLEAGERGGASRILEGLDSLPPVATTQPEEVPEEEAFGNDPEEIFEVHLETLPADLSEIYRALGPAFRDGFLLIQDGKPAEALERFGEAAVPETEHPVFRLERAQALFLAERNEEALAALAELVLPQGLERRGTEMRVVLLARLDRKQEAEDAAGGLWSAESDLEAAILYGELLIDNGKFAEAIGVLKPHVRPDRPVPDVDILVARAHQRLGHVEEARNLLERAVEGFFQGPSGMREAPRFPVWAARELVSVYAAAGEPPERVRSLVQHLIRHDPDRAQEYKESLARYAEEREQEGERGGG